MVLLVDCEGYEVTLMDPAAAPKLRGWRALVELHDFAVPGIADVIGERFSSTHDVQIIEERPRDPDLQFLDRASRSRLVDEFRPAPMSWARLTPLATPR